MRHSLHLQVLASQSTSHPQWIDCLLFYIKASVDTEKFTISVQMYLEEGSGNILLTLKKILVWELIYLLLTLNIPY